MRRKLGSIEHAFTQSGRFAPLAAVSILHINPALDPHKLPAALAELQRRHPLLRATILTQGGGCYFEIGREAPVIPVEVVERQEDDHWRRAATAELNREIGQDGTPLMRLTYLYTGAATPADLIISCHHSIIDAESGTRLLDQLLALCTGGGENQAARFLLPPAEHHFPAPYKGLRALPHKAAFLARQTADEAGYRWQARGTRPQPIHPAAQCAILTRQLDPAAAARLTQHCRRRRVTLNSLLSAAMLSAVHHHLYHNQPMPLRAIMFGSLRPYLSPPIPPDDLGCMITMLRYTLPVEPGMDVWQLAAVLQEKNSAAFNRGEKFLAAAFTKQVIQMTLALKAFRLATTAVSYTGPINLNQQYGRIQVTGLHNFISNNRFGPEFTAAAHLLFGRLNLNFLYLDADMDEQTAAAIADHTCRLLLSNE